MKRDVVLLVEDNPDDAMLICRALGRIAPDVGVRTVADGRQAIQYLSGMGMYKDRNVFPYPRMMLLDLVMPNVDGFQVLDWARRQPDHQRLPIVVLATSSYSPDVKRAYQFGASSFITKPASAEALEPELENALRHWAGRRESSANANDSLALELR